MIPTRVDRLKSFRDFLNEVCKVRENKNFTILDFASYIGLPTTKKSTASVYLTQLTQTGFIKKIVTGVYTVLQPIPDDWTMKDFMTAYRDASEVLRFAKKERREKREQDAKNLALQEIANNGLDTALNTQIGGSHYKDLVMQPIELIAPLGLTFIQGNIIKYVSRYKHKNGIEDLKKCLHYAEFGKEFERAKAGIAGTKRSLTKIAADYFDKFCTVNNIRGYAQYVINYALVSNWDKVIFGCTKLIEQEEQKQTKANDNEGSL